MNNLLFDFNVDKSTKTVLISREFAAEMPLVWDAFSKPEILDQWWAPRPFTSKTKVMTFKPGGRRFYAMVSPDGQERWSVQQYRSITPITNIKLFNCFADENEQLELPGSEWDLNFSEKEGITTVKVSIYNESLERMERLIAMGFKEGMTATMKSLEELLERLSAK